MDNESLINYTFGCVMSDYNALHNFYNIWLDKKMDYTIAVNLFPIANLLVGEGYQFLVDKQYIIASTELAKQIKKIKIIRAKSNKLYTNFKQSTFDSINSFNRNEYEKFFYKNFSKDVTLYLSKDIPNYFITWTNNKPISNYHYLSKKIFDCSIGTYNDDIRPEVRRYVASLFYFIYQILDIFKRDITLKDTFEEKLFFQIDYCELNMAYDYDNFKIVHNPPILMALLDVLCSLNYYIEVFRKTNNDFDLDLKYKYITLFYALVSIKDICKYCDETNYSFALKYALKEHISKDELIVHNQLRKICMHYDFSSSLIFKILFIMLLRTT